MWTSKQARGRRGIRSASVRRSVEARSRPAGSPVVPRAGEVHPECMAPTTTATIRVLLCDDHALVRSGLRRLIESEPKFEVVGEASDAEEAIAFAGHQRPDVLLLDIVMPGRSGIEAIPDLIEASPDTRILVLSMQDDP